MNFPREFQESSSERREGGRILGSKETETGPALNADEPSCRLRPLRESGLAAGAQDPSCIHGNLTGDIVFSLYFSPFHPPIDVSTAKRRRKKKEDGFVHVRKQEHVLLAFLIRCMDVTALALCNLQHGCPELRSAHIGGRYTRKGDERMRENADG